MAKLGQLSGEDTQDVLHQGFRLFAQRRVPTEKPAQEPGPVKVIQPLPRRLVGRCTKSIQQAERSFQHGGIPGKIRDQDTVDRSYLQRKSPEPRNRFAAGRSHGCASAPDATLPQEVGCAGQRGWTVRGCVCVGAMQSMNSFPSQDFGPNPALRWPQGGNPKLSTLEQNAGERVA